MARFLLGAACALAVTYSIGCWLASQILEEMTEPAWTSDQEIGVTTTSALDGW